jgi:hypothetical protein
MARSGRAGAQRVQPRPEPVVAEPVAAKPRICEGTRLEIEQYGKAVDPFTGKTVTRDDVK